MSTVKVQNVQHPSAASSAIALDANGQATLNGLAYPTSGSLSGRNRIINGDMRIDQRNAGAAITVNQNSTFQYAVDRFGCLGQVGDGVFTAQQSSIAPSGFKNSLLLTVTTADTSIGSTQYYFLSQRVEGFNVADFNFGTASAATVTLSFWIRSSVTGTFGGAISNSANNRSYPFSYAINSANTWEQKAVTFLGDTSGTWLSDNNTGLSVKFSLGVGSSFKASAGTWAAGDYLASTGSVDLISTNGATFYITGVQLEAGTVATPFERRSYGQELALCQRYYEQGRINTWGFSVANATLYALSCSYCTTKRAQPTAAVANYSSNIGSAYTLSSSISQLMFRITSNSSGTANVSFDHTADIEL